MCHLRMVDYQIFTKWRMSSDLIINAPPYRNSALRRRKLRQTDS